MDFSLLSSLPPAQARALLPGWLVSYIQPSAPAPAAAARAAAQAVLEGLDDATIAEGLAAYEALGRDYGLQPAHPLARSLSRAYIRELIRGSEVAGLEHLRAARGRPQLWLCNHLSYVDTQVKDCLLADSGLGEVADALLVVAGPKVYSDPYRRIAAMAINTYKTPQSSQVAGEGALSPRELAALALAGVEFAEEWRQTRGPVLIYPEGTRSRTGRIGPFLRAISRYARGQGLWIVPLSVAGTERLFPMDEHMYPQPVRLAFGEPFEASAIPGKTGALEEARRRIAALLPEGYQPAPDDPGLA